LKEALPLLREKCKRIYLETAGTQCAELRAVLDYVDIIAMDIKLPSSTGLKPMWALHRDFLRMALAKNVIVKVVVARKTPLGELELVRDMVSEIDRTLPVILQPVTPAWKVKSCPTIEQLMTWHRLLSEKLGQVRVIPQCQQLLGSR
jgi:7-carboxy-7-deazaguanine synthase